ncbi:hypothetical protein ACIQNU_31755 [Streptomyces sp. NPDC091292]|uniref:hypothetical protein n=1 Tax=Streptomyces sp. NPDC091292 TaxID=3365991 RepID=UPI0038152A2C
MRRTTIAALCLAAVATTALTACGTDTKDDKAGSSGKSTAGSATPSPSKKAAFADLSGQEIVDRAVKATRAATSLTLKGDVPDDGGGTISLDMALDREGRCAGTMGMNGEGTVELIANSDLVYMKYDEEFLRAQSKGQPKAETDGVVDMLADRWVKMSATSKDAKDMAGFCDLDAVLKDFDDIRSAARKGKETRVDGTPAFSLSESEGKDRYTLYVATEGKPYLLKVENTSGKKGETITFTDYDKPVPAKAPADKDVVDIDKLG